MKKLLLVSAMALFGIGQTFAQLNREDYRFFNHLNAGVSLGTDGIGFEVAAPLTYDFSVRAGFAFMPKFKYTKGIDAGRDPAFLAYPESQHVDAEGKLNMVNFKLLFDYYPFKRSSFHVTAGAYIGTSKQVKVQNVNAFIEPASWGTKGLELGTGTDTYTIVSDKNTGDVKAEMKTNAFKPYVGIGFGRSVSKGRVGVQFDLGVQFWGKPEVWADINTFDDNEGRFVTRNMKVDKDRITNPKKDYQDAKDAIKTIEKIIVYPVLNIRVNGRFL